VLAQRVGPRVLAFRQPAAPAGVHAGNYHLQMMRRQRQHRDYHCGRLAGSSQDTDVLLRSWPRYRAAHRAEATSLRAESYS
jgi:hypothetical protein